MTQPPDIPRYQCHKTVWALKIAHIEQHIDGGVTITPADPAYDAFCRSRRWRGLPGLVGDDPGYYLHYADGAEGFMPAKEFEQDYHRLTPEQSPTAPYPNPPERVTDPSVRAATRSMAAFLRERGE